MTKPQTQCREPCSSGPRKLPLEVAQEEHRGDREEEQERKTQEAQSRSFEKINETDRLVAREMKGKSTQNTSV